MPKLSPLTDNKQGWWREKWVSGSIQLRKQSNIDKVTNTTSRVNKQPRGAKTEAVHLYSPHNETKTINFKVFNLF